MAKTLPKHVIIQSSQNNEYLHYYPEHPALRNALRFTGGYSFELHTRFELVPATNGTGFFHIRSLQNNKFLGNFGGSRNWVGAIADKPEENQSDKQNCTLFQPVFLYSNNNRVLKLRHVSSSQFLTFFHGSGPYYGLLYLWSGNEGYDVCTFIDWGTVVVLPDIIRIKGDNGFHLKAYEDGYMDFGFKADNTLSFDFEVSPSRDGGIRLRNMKYGTYLTELGAANMWLRLLPSSTHDTATVFLPTIHEGSRIVLRSLKNGMFCIRYTGKEGREWLASLKKRPHQWLSILEIEEPVISREIDIVGYNFPDARRYNEKIATLVADDCTNRTSEPMESQFHIKTSVTNKTTWTVGVTNTRSTKVNFSARMVKALSVGYEETSMISGSWEHVNTQEKKEEVGKVDTLTVDPGERVKASTVGTRFTYEIPYSYNQYDVMEYGDSRSVTKHDGLLIGRGGYGYDTKTEKLPLEPFPQDQLLSLK